MLKPKLRLAPRAPVCWSKPERASTSLQDARQHGVAPRAADDDEGHCENRGHDAVAGSLGLFGSDAQRTPQAGVGFPIRRRVERLKHILIGAPVEPLAQRATRRFLPAARRQLQQRMTALSMAPGIRQSL